MSTKKKAEKRIQWYNRPWIGQLILVALSLLLYANTITHDFTQDDAIVIYDNDYTKSGVSGIKDIFSKDSFAGFFKEEGKSQLVSGGRYRPMTLAVFALVYEWFGESTMAFHILSILCYALLACMLYLVIKSMDYPKNSAVRSLFALVATAVFIAHPIHTEAVANVKGLDEIFSLLWSLLALFFAVKYINKTKIIMLVLMGLAFFIAMMSKENAAAFVVLIPLTLFGLLKKPSGKRILWAGLSLISVFIFYVFIRGSVIGWEFGDAPNEMMNNPFIKLEGNKYIPFSTGEWLASIIYAMGKYLQLLFVPHPLTHDYYPRVFGVVNFADPAVILSCIMNTCLIAIAILGIKKKSFISFCIFWFYATIALMSNVVFPIGTHLSERFLFTPSVAFALLVAYGYIKSKNSKLGTIRKYLLFLLLILFSIKTITRNQVWASDFKLFTTDVHVSKNSAKVRNAAGGALVDAAIKEEDTTQQRAMLTEAIVHLKKATEIHPNYKNAYLLMGNGYSYLKEYDNSIASFDHALRLDPYYDEASGNLIIVLREGARHAGQVLKDYNKAINYLSRALSLAPEDYTTNSLMGVAYGSAGNHKEAIIYFEKAISIDPNIARAYVNLGYAQLNMGDEDESQINFQRAVEIDPKALDVQQ